MKNDIVFKIGSLLMKVQPIKVCIIDDVETYFNKDMLNVASARGNISFERYKKCDTILLKNLVETPRDIIIIDIKGTVSSEVGKDGFDIAKHIYDYTSTFVAITSAHKYHLKNRKYYGDYIITDRLLTPVDFTEEIHSMIEEYLSKKSRFYKKLLYKTGKFLIKKYGLT